MNAAFTAPLVVNITDQYGNPLSGLTVTFAGSGSGAGVTFPNGNTAITNTQGRAILNVDANSTIGSYTVTASVAGLGQSASFDLQNIAVPVPPPIPIQPPVVSAIGLQAVPESRNYAFIHGQGHQPGRAPLTFSLAAAAPAGAAINAETGLFTWTPSENNNSQTPGTYTFTVTVAESGSPAVSSSTTFTILVGPSSADQGTGLASRLAVANGLTQSYEF